MGISIAGLDFPLEHGTGMLDWTWLTKQL